MAAAMKMDELLVSWLGSDTVYEEVLTLIENHRAFASNNSNNSSNSVLSPPGSPTRRVKSDDESKSLEEGDSKVAYPGSDNDDEDGSINKKNDEARHIPPFYRPPGTRTIDGMKTPPLRQKRKDNFDQDQSWDGFFSRKNTSSGERGEDRDGTMPPPPPPSSDSSVGTGGGMSVPSTAAMGNGAGTTPPMTPIRDQVTAIFNELGKGLPKKTKDGVESYESDDGLEVDVEKKYLTMDNFVKITKDICSFPTFFNRPLYKRILYLWNRRNMETLEEQLELWKEYDENDAIMSVLGVEPFSNLNDKTDKEEKPKEEEGGSVEETSKDEMSLEQRKMKLEESIKSAGGDVLITYDIFHWFWCKEMEDFDLSERFYRLVKKPYENYIGREDFSPYIKELLRDHPGLEFLSNHAEFQDKYAVTVITRIFYSVNKCHSGRITARQIRRSDLLSAFQQVDEEEDINKVTRYFSYEHFYVLYCRFWELDHDRDYKITREDLSKYGDQCLSHMIVDRIFDAAPKPFEGETKIEDTPVEEKDEGEDKKGDYDGNATEEGDNKIKVKDGTNNGTREYLTYEDFIFFMLSEEDKANDISVHYWFSCIDVDGDGKLNNMEMRSFYALQQHRMQSMGHEHIPFEDMLCQMIDMVKPANNDFLVVEDFLQTECLQVSGSLFDALFNLNKYMQFEQRDPFQERQKREDEFETDWDRFACMDYNRLAMEEEAREEDGMEIDWVTVEDDEEEGEDFNLGLGGGASEAPF